MMTTSRKRKLTKDAANYRYGAESRHCEDCSMFIAPESCTLVTGQIARRGTCRFWEPKKKGVK